MLFKYKLTFLIIIIALTSCGEIDYSPKPRAYYRIDFPKEREYKIYDSSCNYKFNHPVYSVVVDKERESCNKMLVFPQYKATLYLTYIELKNREDLFKHLEGCRTLAYEHRIKADAINEIELDRVGDNIFGTKYEIKGNVASNYQFFVTDSVKHFFRGAFYFETTPNIDSLKPVLDYLSVDMDSMINSIQWK